MAGKLALLQMQKTKEDKKKEHKRTKKTAVERVNLPVLLAHPQIPTYLPDLLREKELVK